MKYLELMFTLEQYKNIKIGAEGATDRDCAMAILVDAQKYLTMYPMIKNDIDRYRKIYGV